MFASTPHETGWLQQTRKDFWGLSSAIAMVGLTLGTVLPLSALQLNQAGYQSGLIGFLMAVHAMGLMLAMPLTEISVVIFGTRRVLQLASIGAALSCALLQYGQTPLLLGAGLLVLGLLLGLVFNLAETWVNDIVPKNQRGRWLAIHCTIFTLFQLGGPLLLPRLPADHEYQICGTLLLLALPAYRWLGERPQDQAQTTEPSPAWWKIIRSAPAIVWSTVLFALFDALILGLLPLYGHLHGLSESQALLSASVVLAGDTTLEWVVGVLADRFGRLPVHVACGLTLLITAPLLPLAIGHEVWWLLLFLMGGAAGGIYVLSLMACGQQFSGRRLLQITALLGASWGAASSIGPLLTGLLMEMSQIWALPGVLLSCTAVLLLALAGEEFQNRFKESELP